MAVSDDIFQLLRLMTRKEKAFCRRYLNLTSAGKESSVLELFEKIIRYSENNESYDEEKLKKQLSPEAQRHLPVIKNNLYKLALKSIEEYIGEQSNESKVKSLIEQHEILFSKSLLKQSQSVLMKAKKIAAENELFMYMHTILNKERVLGRYTLDVVSYEALIKNVYTEQVLNLEKIKNLIDMNDLGSRITAMLQKYPTSRVRDEKEMNEIKEVLESPLLPDESKMLSSITLRKFYNFKLVAAEWKKDYSESLKYAKKYNECTEADAEKNRGTTHEYIISLNSVITAAWRAGELEEYEKAYEKLSNISRRFTSVTGRDNLEAFYCLGLAVFSSSANNYRIERGETMLKEAELNFKQYEKELSIQQKIVWYFVIARMCFMRYKYETAGKWINRLITIPNVDVSQDYQCYARVMNLIVAYESGSIDSLEHALRMAYYFLTKRNKVYRYEKIILKYIRESFRVKTEAEINEMLAFMHKDLSAIFADPFEENAFDALNIIPWLETKIK